MFMQQLVDTTVELANKVGPSEIINRIVDDLKDENEQYRKMVMETIEKVNLQYVTLYYCNIDELFFVSIYTVMTISKSVNKHCFFVVYMK